MLSVVGPICDVLHWELAAVPAGAVGNAGGPAEAAEEEAKDGVVLPMPLT